MLRAFGRAFIAKCVAYVKSKKIQKYLENFNCS